MRAVISFLLLLSGPCLAQTYYISPTGNAQNDGLTPKSAWTFQQASKALEPGDEAIVIKGDYPNYNSVFEPETGGTAMQPITLRGENPIDPPVIRRTSGACMVIKVPYIVIENIVCEGSPGSGLIIADTHHVIVRRFKAIRNAYQGITLRRSSDNLIEHSEFRENREGVYISDYSHRNRVRYNDVIDNGHGMIGDRCGLCVGTYNAGWYNEFTGNYLQGNGGKDSDAALIAYSAPYTVVSQNIFYKNRRTSILITQDSFGSRVFNNVAVNNGTACITESNIATISGRNGSSNLLIAGNLLENNCVSPDNPWGGKGPRGALDFRTVTPMDNIRILDNRIKGTINGPDVYVDPTSNIKGLLIQ